ncbi:unnamed protein product [Larinioides sclopetarius]|uniref:C2H2-type domain-containing protein n=1 Tax=Larinioides sclopetarius TaxID=280406 RepID=A0AAV2BUC7_9ARAC
MWDADFISGPLITCVLVIIINILFYWKIMENLNKKKVLNDDETKEKQQESSILKNENPYFFPSNSDSDFECEYTCEICNITFLGLKFLREHEKGAQILKLVRKKEIKKKLVGNLEEDSVKSEEDDVEQTLFAICKTCKKDFMGSDSLELHLKSSAHKKKMARARHLKEIKDEDNHIDLKKPKQKRKGKSKSLIPGKSSESFSDSDSSESTDGNNGADGYSLL